MRRIIAVVLILMSFGVCTLVGTGDVDVYATGGAVILPGPPGTGGGGGGPACSANPTYNQWRIDCAKSSWVFYRVDNSRVESGLVEDITFPYISGNPRFTIPKACAEHADGGFWHYGTNLKGAGLTTDYGGSIATNRGVYGHWSTWPFPTNGFGSGYSTIDSGLLNQSVGDGLYTAFGGYLDGVGPMSGTRENVLRDFTTAWNYLYPDNQITESQAASKIPGTAVFCFWGGMNNKYKSVSNVSVTDVEAGVQKFASTGVVETGEAEAEINVTTDKTVQIVFSQNPISESAEGTPHWDLYRIYYKDEGDDTGGYTPFNNTRAEWFDIEIPSEGVSGTFDSSGISVSTKEGDVTSWSLENGYNVGNVRTFTDSSSMFMARDAMHVTFNETGTWRFCEVYKVYKDQEEGASPEDREVASETKVCAKIVVGEDGKDYYSVSNASNDKTLGYVTTTIVNHRETATSIASIGASGTVRMTFSHNVYSDRATGENDVEWSVSKDWSDTGLNYTVTPVTEVTRSGSHPMNLEELGYYTIDNAYRHNDGYGQYYIVREIYDVTFTNVLVQQTEKFCETVTVDGEQITTSCVEITATPGPQTQPTECGQWTPYSYIISGQLIGSSVTGTTSLTSKIKNESLTQRRSSSPYSNWLGTLVPDGGNLTGPMATTYAMPGDEINWANCYYPGAQALINKIVVRNNVDPHPQAFNTLPEISFRNQITWSNDYKVRSSTDSINKVFKYGSNVIGEPKTVDPLAGASFTTTGNGSNPFTLDVTIVPGLTTIRASNNDYNINYREDAGKRYEEVMTSLGTPYYTRVDYSYHQWFGYWCCGCSRTCCLKRCYYRHLNSFEIGNYAKWTANSGTLTSQTEVKIPYNFDNSASFDITSTNTDGVVYPGDTVKIDNAQVTVGERYNDVTIASYITQVDNAEVRLIAYVSDKPADQQTQEQTPDEMSNLEGEDARNVNICNSGWLDKKQCMEVNKYMYDGVNTTNSPATTTLYTRDGCSFPGPNDCTASVTYGDTAGSYKPLGFSKTYNVFDASAGDYMCFVMAVFPWRSAAPDNTFGNDTTMDPKGVEHKWLITAPRCLQIAKKPSMQVLGSSIYTNGGIVSSVSNKRNLFAATQYYSTIGAVSNPTLYFGSFDEQGIVANKQVTRFASGAAIGRTSSNAAGYGSTSNDFCDRWTPLTFANYSKASEFFGMICGNGADAAGYAGIQDASIVDREAIVDYFIPSAPEVHAEGSYSLGGSEGKDITNGVNKDIRYLNINGGATITGSVLGGLQTRIVKATDNITISGNIKYSGNYSSAAEVPKAVIYTEGDIHINCTVDRIDAILIAKGTVYTCNDYTVADTSTMEDPDRSATLPSHGQLVINGAILADRVELARTYGSAAGKYSGLAAEIVNYDTSALVWGRSMAGANDSNAMSTVYLHELAPRY